MTIELISKETYNILRALQRNFPVLTFNNNGYECLNKSKFTGQEENAFKLVSSILKKHIKGFSEFNNFKLRKSGEIVLRFQYNWNADDRRRNGYFIGVGYLKLIELYRGFEKNETMKALIDGREVEFVDCYEQGIDTTGRKCDVAWHRAVLSNKEDIENFKVITCGNVYIFNYNPRTYTKSKPETFKEYLRMKKLGKEIKFT
ncbi:hypothetical protein [Tenacibaculum sp.]|uniref:hypothetical protein n=1 Tax=Tenacibaculum sp. TaxID=1906242 RepID=UPI003D0AA43D